VGLAGIAAHSLLAPKPGRKLVAWARWPAPAALPAKKRVIYIFQAGLAIWNCSTTSRS
jgi:hypothetical protein